MASFLSWRGLNIGEPGHPCSKVSANDCCEYLGQVLLNSFGTAIGIIIVVNTIFLFYSKLRNTASSCKYKIQQVKSKSYLEVAGPAVPCSDGKGLFSDLSRCLQSATSLLLSPLTRAGPVPREEPGPPAKTTSVRQCPRPERRRKGKKEVEEEVVVEEEEGEGEAVLASGEDRRSLSRSQSRSCSPQRCPPQERVCLGDDEDEVMEDEEEEEEEEESCSSATAPAPPSHRDGRLAARGPCPLPPPSPATNSPPGGRLRDSPSPSYSSSCAAAATAAPAALGIAGGARAPRLSPSSASPSSASPSSPSQAGARSTSFAASCSSRAGGADGAAGPPSFTSSSCASVSPAPGPAPTPPRSAYPRGPVCPRPCCCGREPPPVSALPQRPPRGGHDTSPWRLPVYRECPAAALRQLDTSPARPSQPWRGGQGLARGADPPTAAPPIRICSTRHLRPEGGGIPATSPAPPPTHNNNPLLLLPEPGQHLPGCPCVSE